MTNNRFVALTEGTPEDMSSSNVLSLHKYTHCYGVRQRASCESTQFAITDGIMPYAYTLKSIIHSYTCIRTFALPANLEAPIVK